jgi:hypothetical protein
VLEYVLICTFSMCYVGDGDDADQEFLNCMVKVIQWYEGKMYVGINVLILIFFVRMKYLSFYNSHNVISFCATVVD